MEWWIIALIVLVVAGSAFVVVQRSRASSASEAAPPDGPGPMSGEPGTTRADPGDQGALAAAPDRAAETAPDAADAPPVPPSLRDRLARTRDRLSSAIGSAFGSGVSDQAWERLEEALVEADVGVAAASGIVEGVRSRSRSGNVSDLGGITTLLAEELRTILDHGDPGLAWSQAAGPTVWLVTGVNGTGKTTTIGKLADERTRAGHDVVLAAADTFRAAAADQLAVWAERTGAHLVRGPEGADPASVAFEGYDAAASRGADLLIVDTAGRLHNRRELMDELGKVRRVLEKRAGAIDEVLLVLDATTGQNGIAQARAFLDAVDVTGIALTKLDGSSKGGIVVAVTRELGIPVKIVGLGEGIGDLAEFDAARFVDGLLGR